MPNPQHPPLVFRVTIERVDPTWTNTPASPTQQPVSPEPAIHQPRWRRFFGWIPERVKAGAIAVAAWMQHRQ